MLRLTLWMACLACATWSSMVWADSFTAEREIRIGVQRSALPFAFYNEQDRSYHGYSVDLCRRIVSSIESERSREYETKWVEVTSKTRFVHLLAGNIDLECGSTSSTAARQRVGVAFSRTIFVSDVGVLLAPQIADRSHTLSGWLEQMRAPDRTVVTTNGSTSVHLLQVMDRNDTGLPLRVTLGSNHEDSLKILIEGRAQAFAMDRVLLAARLAADPHLIRDGYRLAQWSLVAGKFECYGIAMRAVDRDLRDKVDQVLTKLIASGEAARIYQRWFERRSFVFEGLADTPASPRIWMPMSDELAAAFKGARVGQCN